MQAQIPSVLELHIVILSGFFLQCENMLTLLRLVLNMQDKFQIRSIGCF